MKNHVSSEAMEQALAGRADAATATHLESCEECAQELIALRQVLGAVRESAVLFAEREHVTAARTLRAAETRRAPVSPWQSWVVAACAVVMLAVGVPVERHHHAAVAVASVSAVKPVQVAATASSAPISDEALLNDVASDLSTSVPQPLAPLTVASSTSTSGSTQSTD